MMSQNLSIFSSSPAAYLGYAASAAVFFLCTIFGLSFIGERFNLIDLAAYVNYHQQLKKIDSSPPVVTLFVGDSSLGAMLDSSEWSKLQGNSAIHLALNASDGYGGSLNMVRRSLDHLRPRNIIIMHTADMMTRDVSYRGYIQSVPGNVSISDIPLAVRLRVWRDFYFNFDIAVATLRGLVRAGLGLADWHLGKEYALITNVTGAPGWIAPGRVHRLLPSQVKSEKGLFLKQLAGLCQRNSVNCIYAHGPIYEEICVTSRNYLRVVGERISAYGLTVVTETPICVPKEELANTIYHVRQDLKAKYTKRYYEIIAPHLSLDDK